MDAEVPDPPGEPRDQAATKKGVRGLFGKVNKTKALNSWLEDTALGELIGAGQNADSAALRSNSTKATARQSVPRRSTADRPAPGRQPAERRAAERHGDDSPSTPASRSAVTPHADDPPSTPTSRRTRPATSMAARRPRAGASHASQSTAPQPAAPQPAAPQPAAAGSAAPAQATGTEPDDTWPNMRKRSPVPPDTAASADADVATTQPIPAASDEPPTGTEPSGPHHPRTGAARASRRPLTGAPMYGGPLMSRRPQISPRLRADPRLRGWMIRAIVMLVLFAGFSIWKDWRYGVTAAIIYAVADMVYRSKTTAPVPAAVRVTSAQRYTRRRLRVLQPAGYQALHARKIPGTNHIIDHVVVGPAGVFTVDSQRLDRRLPLRAVDGMLYHGRTSMEGRLDHAKDESRLAAKLIAGELGRRVRVKPAMVMYGPSISWVIMPVKGVDVFDGSRIGTYFRRQTKLAAKYKLTGEQIAMVFAAAGRALPPID